MDTPLQSFKVVDTGYVITASDLGMVLYALGSVTLPFGTQAGFYVTVVNYRGGTVAITAEGGSVRSASGNTSLTTQWASTTLLKLPDSADCIAIGMP